MSQVSEFHAHVYFGEDTIETARAVCERARDAFNIEMGRMHEKPVGPHPRAMYQVAFAPGVFADFVPWLMLNRRDLTILVHPETGEEVPDHQTHPIWLGEKLDLDVEFLRQFDSA